MSWVELLEVRGVIFAEGDNLGDLELGFFDGFSHFHGDHF